MVAQICWILLFNTYGLGQTHWFRHYTNKDGLSYNFVNCSIQDKNGFIWFGTLDGLNRFDGYNFKVFRTGNPSSKNIGNNFVSVLYEDKGGTLWIGTHNGLWKYNSIKENFTRLNFTFTKWIFDITEDKHGNLWFISLGQLIKYNTIKDTYHAYSYKNCVSIMATLTGEIWVGTNTGQLSRYDPKRDTLISYNVFNASRSSNTKKINRLLYTPQHTILIGTQDQGLKIFDTHTNTYKDLLSNTQDGKGITVTDILKTAQDEYWVSTTEGIYIYHPNTGKINHINQNNDPNSLSDDYIQDLNMDKDGGIWICSKYEGINYYHRNNNLFTRNIPTKSIQNPNVISQIIPDNHGNLYIATQNNGLYILDPAHQSMERHPYPHKHIESIMIHENELWIGKGQEGLDIVDKTTGQRLSTYNQLIENRDINGTTNFNNLFKTSTAIIAGTNDGVFIYDPISKQLKAVKGIEHIVVSTIFEDHEGGIWIGSAYSGLFYIDPKAMTGTPLNLDFSDGGHFNNTVTSIAEDEHNNIWLSTEGQGIAKYDRNRKKLTFITTDEGLPSNNTFKILKGKKNTLWIATAAGLAMLDLYNLKILPFTENNGLPVSQFNYNAGYAAANGMLYFGSTRGLLSFDENHVLKPVSKAPLYITGIQAENKELLIDTGQSPLSTSIIRTKTLNLPYDNSSISIDVAALSYQSPLLTQYQYLMDGIDKTWTSLKTNRKIYYSKLPPGQYTFKVRAAIANGHWGPTRSLIITISPPWWQSSPAYVLYTALAILFIYLTIQYYHRKIKEKNARMIDYLNHEKDKEIYEAKIDFFTNVAHEIRTPLSLIVAPIEKIEQATHMDEVKSNLSLLQKNANRLVSLTNQLLDFRKIEQKDLKLNFIKTNFVDLLTDIYQSFQLIAASKGYTYQLQTEASIIYAYIDREAMTKILSNLIHNAIKYALKNILIILSQQDEHTIKVTITNDGKTIPENLKNKLFEPFYRFHSKAHSEGTGIGLAMAKSLTELHKGSLQAKPQANHITFQLTVPIHQEIQFEFEKQLEKNTYSATSDKRNEKKTHLLIVEDSEDILNFLKKELEDAYHVHTATNGISALELLHTTHIDLVLSDVMMPEMDGFELCQAIKTSLHLSHTPVILLTAKNNIQAKVEGLHLGADTYIEKPFSPTYVKAQIVSLLENRQRTIRRFATSAVAEIGSIAISKADDLFLSKLNEVILANLQNTALDVDFLAASLNMSRRNLYRKINGISGVSPSEMITIIRLKKAAELLLTTDKKIYEIAMETGFKSSDTFTRNFIKQFSQTPTAFGKKVHV